MSVMIWMNVRRRTILAELLSTMINILLLTIFLRVSFQYSDIINIFQGNIRKFSLERKLASVRGPIVHLSYDYELTIGEDS